MLLISIGNHLKTDIQGPLHKLLVGSTKRHKRLVCWNSRAEKAFIECKTQIANATLLGHPIDNAIFYIQSNTLDAAMGAVLKQLHNEIWQFLDSFWKRFAEAQKRYNTYHRQLQAIYSGQFTTDLI